MDTKADHFSVAHAYTPRETGSHGGGDHITTSAPLSSGRLVRASGDPLCKPASKFWGLDARPERPVSTATCKRCMEIARRLGVVSEAS